MSDDYDTLLNETEYRELLLSRCAFNASEILNLIDMDGDRKNLSVILKQYVETIWKDTKDFAVRSIYRWDVVSKRDEVESTFTEFPEDDPEAWNPDSE